MNCLHGVKGNLRTGLCGILIRGKGSCKDVDVDVDVDVLKKMMETGREYRLE